MFYIRIEQILEFNYKSVNFIEIDILNLIKV